MGLLNYTSNQDADKTAQQIAKCLSLHGARAVLTEYNREEGTIEAISFRIELNGKDISFRLPCDWRPVYAVINKGKRAPINESQRSGRQQQAVKTAWKIVHDWVEAQMALVETQMASTLQVFLPYAQSADGSTLYEKIEANPQLFLGGK